VEEAALHEGGQGVGFPLDGGVEMPGRFVEVAGETTGLASGKEGFEFGCVADRHRRVLAKVA